GKEKYFHFFVAEFNDEVIGIVFFYHSYSTLVGKSLILETIIVKPKYHNKGFRKALIYKFYEFAYQQKIQRITQAINDKDIPIIKKSIKNGTYLLDGIRIVQIDDIALKTFIKNN
ncbi:MAG: GNAT family N-acetyltransferase, partial [Flavobacteriaceae bacterium]